MRAHSLERSPPTTPRQHSHLTDHDRLSVESFAKRVVEGTPRCSDDTQGPTPEEAQDVTLLLTNDAIASKSRPIPVKIGEVKRDKLKRDKRAGRQKMGLLGRMLRWFNLK